ncbi:cytochrome P450 [Imleria badia]|nr:cytochrome P450 [Imleria badia]
MLSAYRSRYLVRGHLANHPHPRACTLERLTRALPILSQITIELCLRNLLQMLQNPVGEADFAWQGRYGNTVPIKSILGEERLIVTDTKALQRMLNTSLDKYPKPPNLRAPSYALNGRGVAWAVGKDHKRHRGIMHPGFGPKGSKAFLPVFKDCAGVLSAKWDDVLGGSQQWLSRGALDAIGRAAFDVQFGTLQDDSHPLAKMYRNYFSGIFGQPSAEQIFVQVASKYIPAVLLYWMFEKSSSPRLARAREDRADALLQGKANTDIFTLLVKANMDATAKMKTSDDEVLAQMLYLEAMSYLNAVIKEGLRFHPPLPHSLRIALQDDVLPPSKPIWMNAGEKTKEIVVPKGTEIVASIAAYNRDTDIWGEDARVFKPERWLDSGVADKKLPVIDCWPSCMHCRLTLCSGTRACLGWRFAVLEIQAFLSTLVGKFEFAMTDRAYRIVRLSSQIMSPMVDGELGRRGQLSLSVSRATQDDEI